MPDLSGAFISYSREDSEFALRLAKDLKAAGASVWIDQLDIRPGDSWDNSIEEALNGAQYMLLILSPASAKSDNVRDEVSYALEQGKIVIPILYVECLVPLRLQRKQRIDFRADYAEGLKSLLYHLRIDHPNPEVLEQAAADHAHRQAAWQTRETEAQRLQQRREKADRPDHELKQQPHHPEDIPPQDPPAKRPSIPKWVRRTAAGTVILAVALLSTWLFVNRDTSERTLQGHAGDVYSVAFNLDGRTLASGSDDKTVKLWDPISGTLLRTLEGHGGSVWSVAFSPDGRTLASGSVDNTIKLWDPASGALLRTLQGHTDVVYSIAFSPDGHTLASGSDDKTIKLWDTASGTLLRTLQGHVLGVTSVAFSPDGRTLASGSADHSTKLWNPASGTLLHTLQGHTSSVFSVAFSPDGRTLASGSVDNTIKLWDPASGTLVRTLEGHTSYVISVVFSPDGRTLASGSWDKTIKLWDPTSGTLLRTLKGHASWVDSVAFSPDGRTLATGSRDSTIKLWNVANLH